MDSVDQNTIELYSLCLRQGWNMKNEYRLSYVFSNTYLNEAQTHL